MRNSTDDILGRLREVDAASLDRLHERLVDEADREELLDVAYRTIDTPVGELLLAATGHGLVRIAFEQEGEDETLEALASKLGPRILRAPERLEPVARELDEYFEGKRRRFDLSIDLTLTRGFRRSVIAHLPDIPYGRTESYSQVATAVGNPKAARAVGSACATNPIPIVVPCHRVLRADGSLGGYGGGLEAKTALLRLERARS